MRWYGLVGLLLIAPASAEFSDPDAAALAAASPAVKQSLQTIETAIARLPADMRAPTHDGLLATDTCIAYRQGETAATRRAVVDELLRQGLVTDAAAATRSLYGYPVRTDGKCVHTAAPFLATPGSEEDSHHSWPGGLADHIAFNLHAGEDMVARYGALTGNPYDSATLNTAVLWHDWAKRLVLHWSDKGVVSYESRIGGTASHHVISLAEAMARGLPAKEILIQVCAHQAPQDNHDAKVIGWVRAAAIIARIDPLARGYLKSASGGYAIEVRPECRIHALSDGNWVYAVPAVQHAKAVIARLAPQLGHQPDDRRFLEQALSYYGAERFDPLSDAEALKLLRNLPK